MDWCRAVDMAEFTSQDGAGVPRWSGGSVRGTYLFLQGPVRSSLFLFRASASSSDAGLQFLQVAVSLISVDSNSPSTGKLDALFPARERLGMGTECNR